jgi:hypothetical protein
MAVYISTCLGSVEALIREYISFTILNKRLEGTELAYIKYRRRAKLARLGVVTLIEDQNKFTLFIYY